LLFFNEGQRYRILGLVLEMNQGLTKTGGYYRSEMPSALIYLPKIVLTSDNQLKSGIFWIIFVIQRLLYFNFWSFSKLNSL